MSAEDQDAEANGGAEQDAEQETEQNTARQTFGFDRTPRTIWACPCGYTAPYNSVVSHRKGAKQRPACTGKIYQVGPPPAPVVVQSAEAEPEPSEPAPPPSASGWSYGEELEAAPDDPEALADYIFRQRHPNGNGHGTIDNSDLFGPADGGVPEGSEFDLDQPAAPVVPSQYREVVYLPAVVRVMFDWAKAQGWRQGDGSMSAFVLDVMLDHWKNCWGKLVVVADAADIRVTNRVRE